MPCLSRSGVMTLPVWGRFCTEQFCKNLLASTRLGFSTECWRRLRCTHYSTFKEWSDGNRLKDNLGNRTKGSDGLHFCIDLVKPEFRSLATIEGCLERFLKTPTKRLDAPAGDYLASCFMAA